MICGCSVFKLKFNAAMPHKAFENFWIFSYKEVRHRHVIKMSKRSGYFKLKITTADAVKQTNISKNSFSKVAAAE